MAEETPDSLSGFFGGHAASGSSARLNDAEDRLASAVDSISARLRSFGNNLSSGWASGGPSDGPTSHRASANGGGVTFSGQPGGAGQGGAGGPSPTPGAHAAFSGLGGYAGNKARGMFESAGGGNGIAKKVALGVGTGIGVYTLNHASDQITNQAIASQFTYGSNRGNPNYSAMFAGNYTAANSADLQKYQQMMASSGGASVGSATYAANRRMVEATSLIDPTITNTASQQASLSLGSVGSFNRLAGMGINPMGAGKSMQGDPMSVARQILTRVGGSRIKTSEQIDAAFGPAGGINVTLDNYVANGLLSSESVGAVRANMRAILKAQIQGTSYESFRSSTQAAAADMNTPGILKDLGFGNSALAGIRQKEGASRDTEAKTINGFIAGLTLTTSAAKKMRDIVNQVLGIPGVGTTFGEITGLSAGGIGSVLGPLGKAVPGLSSLTKLFGGSTHTGMSHGGSGGSMYAGGTAPKQSGRTASSRQTGGGSASMGGGANATAAVTFAPPGPGLNDLDSETDYGPRNIGQGFHTGIDLMRGMAGATIRASAAGTVSGAGWGSSGDSGYGNTVMIDHGGGYTTMYAHMASITVRNGQTVTQGQGIGTVGGTGSYARGPHLHFEIHINGKYVDPTPYLKGKRVNISGSSVGGTTGSSGSGGGASLGSTGSYSNASAGSPSGNVINSLGYSESGTLGGVGSGSGVGMMGGGSSSGSSGAMSGTSGSVGNGAGGTIRNGTFNLLFSSSNKASKSDLSKILGDADVLGLTEYTGKKAALAKFLAKQGWGTYHGKGDAAITWNKDKYSLEQSGDWMLTPHDWPRPGAPSGQYAAYGLLKDKETGQQFWEVAAHLISKAGAGRIHDPARVPIKNKEIAALNALYTKLSSGGLPVFITGDQNMDEDRGDWVGIGNTQSNWGKNQRGPGTDRPNNYIDNILANPALVSLMGSQVVTGLNSDHNAVLAQYNLAGQAQGPTSTNTTGQSGLTPASARALGRAMMANYGWASQYGALDNIYTHESGWRWNADNPTSSAYGIPQSLPGSKMASAGADWRTNPATQIHWGLDYIKGRYGDPTKAWDFWQKHNWYDKGSWDVDQDQDARIHRREMILPATIAEAVRGAFNAPTSGSGAGGGIVFQSGAIVVQVPDGTSRSVAKAAASAVVDEMVQDKRIKDLMAGRY